jgi:hypothetical protein
MVSMHVYGQQNSDKQKLLTLLMLTSYAEIKDGSDHEIFTASNFLFSRNITSQSSKQSSTLLGSFERLLASESALVGQT